MSGAIPHPSIRKINENEDVVLKMKTVFVKTSTQLKIDFNWNGDSVARRSGELGGVIDEGLDEAWNGQPSEEFRGA